MEECTGWSMTCKESKASINWFSSSGRCEKERALNACVLRAVAKVLKWKGLTNNAVIAIIVFPFVNVTIAHAGLLCYEDFMKYSKLNYQDLVHPLKILGISNRGQRSKRILTLTVRTPRAIRMDIVHSNISKKSGCGMFISTM